MTKTKSKLGSVDIKLKFTPQLAITFAGEDVGKLTFEDMKTMAKFVNRLSISVKALIEEFEGRKHREQSIEEGLKNEQ